jgi:hypothetical protein
MIQHGYHGVNTLIGEPLGDYAWSIFQPLDEGVIEGDTGRPLVTLWQFSNHSTSQYYLTGQISIGANIGNDSGTSVLLDRPSSIMALVQVA